MKNIKRLLLTFVALIAIVALSSCSSSTRNTQTPYGSIDTNSVIATSSVDGNTINYTAGQYYDTLRKNGYTQFTSEMKKIIYKDELDALTSLLYSEAYSDLTADQRRVLSYDSTKSISEDDYNYLLERYTKTINNYLASSVYSTTSLTTFNGYTDKAKAEYVTKFIESRARAGFAVTEAQIEVIQDTKLETIQVNYKKLSKELIVNYLLSYSENLFGEKALYKIAGEEYVETLTEDDDEGTKERNSYNYFTEEYYQSTYESTYKTYGTYNAIIIQFNSKREALSAIDKALTSISATEITSENVDEFYLALYMQYYKYRGDNLTSTDNDLFKFEVTKDINELSEFPSAVSTLVTETLEAGEYLTEARNVSNKYIMAYHISTTYEYHNTDDASESLEYDDLSTVLGSTRYNELIALIQRDLIETYGSNYSSTALNFVLRDSEIKIYDPIIEYNFKNSYSNYYELIQNSDFNSDLVATINGTDITVDQFYTTLSNANGASTVLSFFQLAYADLIVNDYVDSDTQDSNRDTLQSAIDTFNKDNNTTYPKEIGLENYLLLAYGYRTQDEVLKYYYNASSALSAYLNDYISESWADNGAISSYAKRILGYLLADGNSKYSELFNINLDHILIYIDDDGDGSPDDPNIFLSKNEAIKSDFEEAVVNLAKAIYTEAINEVYSDNTLYETLAYIVKAYNRGDKLYSDSAKTWDDYKKYNFLLTAEQLASSGDITQESVSNFVEPFADYVKELYSIADENDLTVDEDNGNFITIGEGEEYSGGLLKEADDASHITINTLCTSTFGYHFLVINEYDGPDTLKFTTTDDTYGYQKDMSIVVTKGEDEDDEDDDVIVTVSSYNESEKEANVEQLFIYMVQSYNGTTSSLDSDISSLLSSLFTASINAYSGSNFQTVLLMDLLNIDAATDTLQAAITTERNYYVNQVTSYDNDSTYYKWLNDSTNYNFKRQ